MGKRPVSYTHLESAGRVGEDDDATVAQIERAYGFDGGGNFLPVGAYVLHGRASDAAGNATEALDPRTILHDCLRHEVIPVDARAHHEEHGVSFGISCVLRLDSAERNS